MTLHRVSEQSGSHAGLLDKPHKPPSRARFDAIIVPTYRPTGALKHAIRLARRTRVPLVVVCSQAARGHEVIDLATRAKIEAHAIDLPRTNSLGISFETSSDKQLIAASPDWTRDLATKRNLGLILARLLGWSRLMFLDDDIYGITERKVEALAAALDDHNVSALIPQHFPDNSVACHARRLGGGKQDVFASASGMGVRCDRDDLSFFPNIYNEDWFFFSKEAASHKIARVGLSRQLDYDPYENPHRAAQEEFGDLLAEGLYWRLDRGEDIQGVDAAYWSTFREVRRSFHNGVTEALDRHKDRDEAARALNSIRAAQSQLDRIGPSLCQRFVDRWQTDLATWREYLKTLQRSDSIEGALKDLRLDPAASYFSSR